MHTSFAQAKSEHIFGLPIHGHFCCRFPVWTCTNRIHVFWDAFRYTAESILNSTYFSRVKSTKSNSSIVALLYANTPWKFNTHCKIGISGQIHRGNACHTCSSLLSSPPRHDKVFNLVQNLAKRVPINSPLEFALWCVHSFIYSAISVSLARSLDSQPASRLFLVYFYAQYCRTCGALGPLMIIIHQIECIFQ